MDGAVELIKQAGVDLQRHRFDVDQYRHMAEAGILLEDDSVELIEGELITMPAVGVPHIGTVMVLTRLLVAACGDRAWVSVQSPVRLDRYNEPQPDFAILRPRAGRYQVGDPPGPAEILLLVEVASSSLAYDRRVKLPLYARHGVPEVWIVDLDARVIDVHRGPAGDGYGVCSPMARGDVLEVLLLPGVRVGVSGVFGPLP